MTISRSVRAVFLISALLGLSACGTQMILKPQLLGQDCVSRPGLEFNCGPTPTSCVNNLGAACRSSAPAKIIPGNELSIWPGQQVMVGLASTYESGTPPCACQKWVTVRSNAYVQFDTSEIRDKKVTAAVISWKRRTVVNQKGGVASNAPVSCYQREVFAPLKSWQVDTPAIKVAELGGLTAQAETAGLLALVQDWADGKANHGLMIKPINSMAAEKTNDQCINELSDFEIAIRYR